MTPHDRLAVWSGRRRTHRYIRVRRITREADTVTLFLAEGAPMKVPAKTRIGVAPRTTAR